MIFLLCDDNISLKKKLENFLKDLPEDHPRDMLLTGEETKFC